MPPNWTCRPPITACWPSVCKSPYNVDLPWLFCEWGQLRNLLKFKWIEAHDLAEVTRTQCSTQSTRELESASAFPKTFLLRRKWLKNWNCWPNLSLTQIQRMKLLKNRFFPSSESLSVRLSSTRGEEHHRGVNWPAAGISSPRFPQAAFRVSNGHSREDREIGARQVN